MLQNMRREQIMRSGIAGILTHHFSGDLKRLVSIARIEGAFKQGAERFDGRLALCERAQAARWLSFW